MSWFSLSANDADKVMGRSLRLRSYKAVNKGPTLMLTLTVEVSDPMEAGYTLRDLEQIRQAHNRPVTKPRKIAKVKPLALPAPEHFE